MAGRGSGRAGMALSRQGAVREAAPAGCLFFPLALNGAWIGRLADILDGYSGRDTAEPQGRGGAAPRTEAGRAAPEGESAAGRGGEPCPRLGALRDAVGRIGIANGRLRLAGWRLLYQRHYLFAFRITLAADEIDQWIAHVLIDPVSERVHALPADPGWASFPLWGLAAGTEVTFPRAEVGGGAAASGKAAAGEEGAAPKRSAGAEAPYVPRRLYRRAQALLPRVIGPRWRAFCSRLHRRREAERERIDGYYRALQAQREEERERLRMAALRSWAWEALWGDSLPWEAGEGLTGDEGAAGPSPSFLPSSSEGGPDGQLEEEWRRRLEELELRYRPRAEAELVYGAVVIAPCLEVHWRLAHPRRRDVVTCYDFLRSDWLDWRCERCERPLGAPGASLPRILPDGSLHCCDCSALCADCGAAFSPDDGGGGCHLCGAPLCSGCVRPCLLEGVAASAWGLPQAGGSGVKGRRAGPESPTAACPRCRAAACPGCLALAYGFAGAGLTAPPPAG